MRMQLERRASFLLGLLFLVAASPAVPEEQQPASVTLPAALARVLTDYESAWQKKDAAALAALFAADGFVLANGSLPVRGRAKIQQQYAAAGGPLALRAFAFAAEDSIAYILGGYAAKSGGPDTGKFTLTLRLGPQGRWLIVSDMDNPNKRR